MTHQERTCDALLGRDPAVEAHWAKLNHFNRPWHYNLELVVLDDGIARFLRTPQDRRRVNRLASRAFPVTSCFCSTRPLPAHRVARVWNENLKCTLSLLAFSPLRNNFKLQNQEVMHQHGGDISSLLHTRRSSRITSEHFLLFSPQTREKRPETYLHELKVATLKGFGVHGGVANLT